MRKADVKPGVVYAYQRWGRHPTDPVEPLVFLSSQSWIGTLRQDARGYGDYAFKRPRDGRKPQAGTVHNDGTIGYPAVILPAHRMESGVRDIGKLVTLRDFDAATSARGDGFEFVLVTSMQRVTGEWLDHSEHSEGGVHDDP